MRFLDFYKVLEERAFHGGTHKITDRFSLECVGKGEGVQAYGWGLYFTETQEIAGNYMTAGSHSILIGKKPLGSYRWFQKLVPEDQMEIDEFFRAYGDKLPDKKVWLNDLYQIMYRGEDFWGRLYRTVRGSAKVSISPGYLYSVRIDAGMDELLDWDSGIESSPSFSKIRRMVNSEESLRTFRDMEWLGQHLYENMVKVLGSAKDASLMLLKYGVKGIKYRDQFSRNPITDPRASSHNFVIFDDSLVHMEAGTRDKNQTLFDFGDK